MDAPWRIELFGGLRAESGSRVVTRFSTQKTGTLLAYLAHYLHRVHPREVLIELLWPEREPEAGRQSLSQALSSLRRQLEPPGIPAGAVLIADRASVRLNPDAVTTDVAEFEDALQRAERVESAQQAPLLAHAVELYRGEFLPGYYADWIVPEQERLDEAYCRALHQLIQLLEQAGDLQRALDYARRAVRVDEVHEELHRTLMRLLTAIGQPGAALRHYHALEQRLKEELGTTPSAATRVLARDIGRAGVPADRTSDKPGPRPRLRASDRAKTREPERLTHPPQAKIEAGSNGNLPPHLTRFFGREEELARLEAMLHRAPLVTLTGPGGSGKTRVALAAARRLFEGFREAVWFVPLADLSDAGRIADTVRDALRLPASGGVPPLDAIVAALSRRPSLLVLDNFEHLASEGAPLVQTLLERVPALTCLVTSRQRLDLAGEREFPLAPLPTPGAGGEVVGWWGGDGRPAPHHLTTALLLQFPSVQLFVDRAQAVRPDFQVTRGNTAAVAELCHRLEGIPLAIELAAARAQVLTPAQMLAQLARRFDFLVSRRRTASARHRTLRAALDWSYNLLAPELQQLFARLSVFRGGWTLEAAEAVCGDTVSSKRWAEDSNGPSGLPTAHCLPPTGILDALEQLRACSLVLAEEKNPIEAGTGGADTDSSASGIRFRLLETMREYAGEQLSPEERGALQRRHVEHYVALAEGVTAGWQAEGRASFAPLEADLENIRSGIAWALQDEPVLALRLACAMRYFWLLRGHWQEGRQTLERAMERAPDAPTNLRVTALAAAGHLLHRQGDQARAKALFTERLELSRKIGDRPAIAHALHGLAVVTAAQGDCQTAIAFDQESLDIFRELGDEHGIGLALLGLGNSAGGGGDVAAARSYLMEALTISRRLDAPWGIAEMCHCLGQLALGQGEYAAAAAFLEESLSSYRAIGHKPGVANACRVLGAMASQRQDYPAARSFFEEALAISREAGDRAVVAVVLSQLGGTAHAQGDLVTARLRYDELLIISREIGDRHGAAGALSYLWLVTREQGDRATMRLRLEEHLRICRKTGDVLSVALLFARLGIYAGRDDMDRAARLLAASAAFRETGDPSIPFDLQEGTDQSIAAAREALGEAAFTTAWEAGRALTWEEAAAEALR